MTQPEGEKQTKKLNEKQDKTHGETHCSPGLGVHKKHLGQNKMAQHRTKHSEKQDKRHRDMRQNTVRITQVRTDW